MGKKRKSREEASSVSGVSSGTAKARSVKKPPNAGNKPVTRSTGEWAAPGSVHPERRCKGKARRTGERCKKAAIKGGSYCPSHGGALPGVAKQAKERLLALVEPALVELHRVLTDPKADDAVKVRAALGILDRTGHGPGARIEFGVSRFEETLAEVLVDRSDLLGDLSELQKAQDARVEAWAEYDAEGDRRATSGRIFPDENTVRGEVLDVDPPPHLRG
jgi:hypothetical protein